jgi:Uncharacterized protein, possibly involved in motility
MIKLTKVNGEPIYINPNKIISVDAGDNGIYIDNGQDAYIVTESPEEVARKVLEWKLAMVDYRDTVRGYRQMARQALEELAGLHVKKLDAFIKRMEEQNHDAG